MSQAPSSGGPAPLEPARVAELLHASQMLVVGELAGLGEDGGWHPAPGEWCAREVVGHLIAAERHGFAGRIRAMIDEHRPAFEPWDQSVEARERHDCEKESRALVDEFVTLRRESVAMVKKLDAAALRRSGVHKKVGELFVPDLLHEWVHHDREHTRQLLSIAMARAWPHMANAQKFQDD